MKNLLHNLVKHINSQDQKVIIGISGHGASGKTTFAENLLKLLGDSKVNYINTDPYIIGSNIRKYTMIDYQYRGELHRDKMTACHPAAHHTTALERDIKMLRDGLNFYSIDTSYSRSRLMTSKEINIVEGMSVAFTDPSIYNLKIYLYTDGETEFLRRSIRDVTERGTEIEYLRQSHEERRIQYELFMHPYHRNFDIIIKNSNDTFIIEEQNIY
ncbi:uridine kinase family protein [Mesobacillus jeotgali]|uniref:uridine kinase family protein n=1 Tax=Mesobacillus jeotgali TaxID=129985 RepID=UPI0009A5E422|nr:phosphoribulokinase [Mesobacillus jeotgali]